MATVDADIRIEAKPERVWEVLTDLARYPEWNPFVREASGHLSRGKRLRVTLEPIPGGGRLRARPKLTKVDPPRELRWRAGFILPGFLRGDHSFTLEPAGDRQTRFVQHEEFRGVLEPLVASRVARDVGVGFRAMNEALKTRVEAPAGHSHEDKGGDDR